MVALLKVGQPDSVCLPVPGSGKNTLSPMMSCQKKRKKNEVGSNQASSFNISLQETWGIEERGNQFLTACLAYLIFNEMDPGNSGLSVNRLVSRYEEALMALLLLSFAKMATVPN